MKYEKKLELIQKDHLAEWLQTRYLVDEEISNQQGMWCICGRLATGLHERCCRKFNDNVSRETIKRLSHLIIKPREVTKNG